MAWVGGAARADAGGRPGGALPLAPAPGRALAAEAGSRRHRWGHEHGAVGAMSGPGFALRRGLTLGALPSASAEPGLPWHSPSTRRSSSCVPPGAGRAAAACTPARCFPIAGSPDPALLSSLQTQRCLAAAVGRPPQRGSGAPLPGWGPVPRGRCQSGARRCPGAAGGAIAAAQRSAPSLETISSAPAASAPRSAVASSPSSGRLGSCPILLLGPAAPAAASCPAGRGLPRASLAPSPSPLLPPSPPPPPRTLAFRLPLPP